MEIMTTSSLASFASGDHSLPVLIVDTQFLSGRSEKKKKTLFEIGRKNKHPSSSNSWGQLERLIYEMLTQSTGSYFSLPWQRAKHRSVGP